MFFDALVGTGDIYLNFLNSTFFPVFSNFSSNIIFQQNGDPPHFSLVERDLPNNAVPNFLTRLECPINYPTHFPELTFLIVILKR